MEPWVVQLIQEHIDDLNNPELKSFAKNLVEAVFFKTTADNKRLATLAFETTTRHALASTYENLLQWDKTSKNKIAYCKMPVLYIQSREPFCPEDTLRKYCPRLVVGKVVGAGHWATLEVPNQVNAMIERFLEMS